MNELERYLSARNIQTSAFAGQLGVSVPTVSRLRRGLQRPSLDLALKIETATKGRVKPSSFEAPAPAAKAVA